MDIYMRRIVFDKKIEKIIKRLRDGEYYLGHIFNC